MFVPAQLRELSAFVCASPGLKGMGAGLHDRRPVATSQVHMVLLTTCTGIGVTVCLPGTKALQKQHFCLFLLPPGLHAAAAKPALCCWTRSTPPSIATAPPTLTYSLSFPRKYTTMVIQGKQKGRSDMFQPCSAPSLLHSNSGC